MNLIGILLINTSVGRITCRIIRIAVTAVHDEQILVAITNNGRTVADAIQVLAFEGIRYPRHKHIVQAQGIDFLLHTILTGLPAITPRSGYHPSMKLGSLLGIKQERQFGISVQLPPAFT